VSANARLRVGVAGVGHLGRHHARLLAGMEDVDLVAVADLDPAKASQAAQGGATAETSHKALIGRVDAAVVAVPTIDHLAVARDFIQAGVHVLVEKPIAASLAEADEMLALAEEAGVTLAVGHTERFNPAVEAALAVLTEPRFIEVHRMSGFPERSLDIDVVFDVMIHDLDLIATIDGTEVVSLEAVGVPVLTSRVDIANARVRFRSGCIANLTASRISRDSVRKLRCFQPEMYVSVDAGARELEVWRLRRQDGDRPKIEGGNVPVESGEPLGRELRDFVDAIRDRRPPRVSGKAGRSALALATRVAEAIEENKR
jgi:predicted dehydrogenase